MQSLDGIKFAEMVQMGGASPIPKCKLCRFIKCFPVPDGDTGTNIELIDDIWCKGNNIFASEHIGKTAQALSKAC